jgi:hypothetical protein
MNKKLSTILAVFLILMLTTSTVGAAGAIKLSGAFGLGSLTFNGYATGLGGYRDGVTIVLTGTGIPVVTCTNKGGNQAPGQNPPKVTADGSQFIGPQSIDKKGKAPVGVETEDPILTGTQGGCPNDNWTATVEFIYWTDATLTAIDNTSGAVVATQNYTCVTTRNPDSVSCTQVK